MTRFMRPSDSTMPLWVGHGVAPPIRPVLPPWGTMAMPLSKQSFTTLETSSVLAGRTTTAALPTSEPRQSVHERLLALLVEDQALVAHDGAQAVQDGRRHRHGRNGGNGGIGHRFLSLAVSLAAPARAVIRRRAAQAVVDRKAQSRFRNGHDRDAADAPAGRARAAWRTGWPPPRPSSPRGLRLSVTLAPAGTAGPNASRPSSAAAVVAPSRTGRAGA